MNQDPLREQLENIRPPKVVLPPVAQQRLRLALLDARRSSRVGIALVALPSAFIFFAALTHFEGWRLATFSAVEEWMAQIDRTAWWFIPPLVLVGFPLVGLAANFLALSHFHVDRARHELQLFVKFRPLNVFVSALCIAVLAVVMLYVVGENRH